MKRLAAPIGGLILTPGICSEATGIAVQTLQVGVLQYLRSVGCDPPAHWHIPMYSLHAAIGDVDAVRKYLAGPHVKINTVRAMLARASAEGHADVIGLLIPHLTYAAAIDLYDELECCY